ncbi:flagellar motor protein MotB [Wenzhouxiangella limi]|uniref:Flagellar motor protein MotB n=1 Tax=Wenzhouxiangella limi TaxID=2707351 RepID=A0A845V4N1_9GAMM|nr:flagellar motor protein MotB [Wenzhouxiangella limi]NDY95191.1 flagellar motor protein MotB [Wenzhouxiangella limi]
MSNEKPVIIKRVKKVKGHAHHGGAWKIAYADFVTAMMAFFLLMWLLTVATEEQRRGISDYFDNPLQVSMMGGEGVGEQTRPLPGGGEDLSLSDGEVRWGDPLPQDVEEMLREQEQKELEALETTIREAIESTPSLNQFSEQLLIDITDEGLRVQIVDKENRPMFEIGSARLQPYAAEILAELADLLNEVGNRVSITGHTDAAPYPGGAVGYSNWELSNDRANTARRELIAAGLDPDKILRIVGLASTVPLDPDNLLSPINRRISILVVNRQTEQAIVEGQAAAED